MAEPKDDITEERRILKEAGILDENSTRSTRARRAGAT